MIKKAVLFLLVFCCAVDFAAFADVYRRIKVTAVSENEAKLAALEKYVSEQDSQKAILLEGGRQKITENINLYFPEYVDMGGGIGQVSVNEQQLDLLIRQSSSNNESLPLSFIFVARKVTEVKSFKKREVVRNEESENISESEDGTLKHSFSTQSGGSTTQKKDKIIYEACNMTDVISKVTEVFSKAGFDVVSPADIGLEQIEFSENYVENDNLPADMETKAKRAAREAELPLLSIATMTVGRPEDDDASGMKKIAVSITGNIWDTRGKFAKSVGAVGPVQHYGMGNNSDVAEKNALIEAATIAAEDLVNQLRVRGIN